MAIAPAVFAEDQFKTLVNAYDTGDYRKAAQCGEDLVQKQPGNAQARYYLANAYVKLHQVELAELQYKRCIEISPKSEVAQNAGAALKGISRYLGPPAKTPYSSSSKGYRNSGGPGNGHRKKHGSSNSIPKTPDEERVMNDAQERIRMKENDANRQIENIRRQAQQDINSIPTRYYKIGSRGHMHHGKNPNLAPAKADINGQAEDKIFKIKEALRKDKRDIMDDANRRFAGLRH